MGDESDMLELEGPLTAPEARFGRVITAMLTPFDADGKVDDDAVVKLVDHLFDNGSDGIVVCGTTGESPTLSHDEKHHLFTLVLDAAKGRGPIIAGTGSNNTAESAKLSREAQEVGVDAILSVAPYYNKPSQEGMYQHFRHIAESVSIPVMLYNVPPRTSSNVEASTVIRLARDVSNIVAIKEASGNLAQVTRIISDSPLGFEVYSGDDGLTLPMAALGGVGVVSVASHVIGKDFARMLRHFFAGEIVEASIIHGRMMPVINSLFQPTTPSPAPVKYATSLLGVPVGGLRLPLVECNESERAIVRRALEEYGFDL